MYVITKSDFVAGMKCPKNVWLHKHRPDLLERREPDRMAKEGIKVGKLACNLFENCTQITTRGTLQSRCEATKDAIKAGATAIAEAAFCADNLYCQVDILQIEPDGVIINEVKAVNSVRKTRTKNKVPYEAELLPDFLHDFGFQYHALVMAGLNVKQVNCIHLNKEYVMGDVLEYEKYFAVEDVTEEVREYCENGDLKEEIRKMQDCLRSNLEPDCTLTTKCLACDYWEMCGKDLPSPNVFDLNGSHTKKRDVYYAGGLVSFDALLKTRVLGAKPKKQVTAELYGTEYVDEENIREFLKNIHYPLYFLDFETFQEAIPTYSGQWPYEQVPFQYSLDIISAPGDPITHKEFLAKEGADPRRQIAESLVENIERGACVTAYNMGFEGERLGELAGMFPDLSDRLLDIRESLVDFIVPFNNMWLYNKAMKGKSSIKYVLPALYPGDESLNYQNLPGVQRGDEAMDMFLALPTLNEEERIRQREYMLRYCRLDTFAMIKVYEALLFAARDSRYRGVAEATRDYQERITKEDLEKDKLL